MGYLTDTYNHITLQYISGALNEAVWVVGWVGEWDGKWKQNFVMPINSIYFENLGIFDKFLMKPVINKTVYNDWILYCSV